jgi:hypothetical protein
VIEDEFLALIPPLSFDELAELEASLVEYGGARDPLIAWDRGPKLPPVLVDGHTRLRICERLKLPYHVKGLRFRDKDDALNWMRRNQIGRRNLSRKAFMLLLGEIYNRTKLPDGGRAGRKSHPYAGREVRRTADVLAEEYGVDEKTVRRAAAFQNAAEKLGIADEIAAGRIKADAAAVIKLAASLPENPTKDQIAEALKAGLTRARAQCKKDSLSRASQGWLIPAEPSDCLKAIYFYAKSFLCRRPDGVEALNALLLKLIEENELQVINQRHERGR